jgi:hypothetical protein
MLKRKSEDDFGTMVDHHGFAHFGLPSPDFCSVNMRGKNEPA